MINNTQTKPSRQLKYSPNRVLVKCWQFRISDTPLEWELYVSLHIFTVLAWDAASELTHFFFHKISYITM